MQGLTLAFGVLAAICSMASFTPQVLKIWKEKDASAVSLQMYLVTVAGFAFWIAYGFGLKSWPLMASNGICLALAAAVVALKLRYGDGPKGRPVRRPA